MKTAAVAVVLLIACFGAAASSQYYRWRNPTKWYYGWPYGHVHYSLGSLAEHDLEIFGWFGALPMPMYNNYICSIYTVHTSDYYYNYYGKRDVSRYYYRGNLNQWNKEYYELQALRRKVDYKFKSTYARYRLVPILKQFMNLTEKEALTKLLESKATMTNSALQSIMAPAIMSMGGDVAKSMKAVVKLTRRGSRGVLRVIKLFSRGQCKSLSDSGRQYLCSEIEPLKEAEDFCGIQKLVSALYDACGCGTPPPTSTPAPPPPVPPTTVAPTVAPTTSASTKDCGISAINPAEDFSTVTRTMSMLRIVGGVGAQDGEFPFAVYINMGNSLCGGTLIASKYVLTAAHCVTGKVASDGKVYVGEHNTIDGTDHTEFQVSAIHFNNAQPFDSNTLVNDIAILELSEPVDFSTVTDAGIACLPPATGQDIANGTNCVVTGWGTLRYQGPLPTILNKVTVPTFSGSDCMATFPTTANLNNPATQLCTGTAEGGKDACQGDSGGGLLCPVGNTWVVKGIVSYGERCAEPGVPGIYTNVASYTDWINSVIGS